MSSNLLKMGFANVQGSEKRMIDTNELVARRIEALTQKMAKQETGLTEDGEYDASVDGFAAGLSAEQVEGLLTDEESGEGSFSSVIKADAHLDREREKEAEREQLLAETKGAADAFLADAMEKAHAENEAILAQGRAMLQAEREEVLSQARTQGYQEGFEQAKQEFEAKEQALIAREQAMQEEYEALLKDLEPRFVDAITEAYEYLIGQELAGYRDILIYLIGSAVRNIEGGKHFTVRICAEDYPYVSMEKKQLEAALTSPGATLELVEDKKLEHNQCVVETEGGIFDCGLDTQMSELKQKLKLLSYEKV